MLEIGPRSEKHLANKIAAFPQKLQVNWLHISRIKISDRCLVSWTQDLTRIK